MIEDKLEAELTRTTARERLVILFVHISDTLTGKPIKDTDNIWESYRRDAERVLDNNIVLLYLNDGGYSRIVCDPALGSIDRPSLTLTNSSLQRPKDIWPDYAEAFNQRFDLITGDRKEAS